METELDKNREIEALCKQLEFTNLYIRENINTASSRQLIQDNQEAIDRARLTI